jgi:hypothetical protein
MVGPLNLSLLVAVGIRHRHAGNEGEVSFSVTVPEAETIVSNGRAPGRNR